MFNTLESTWDNSARLGWSTAASFSFQALALSLLLAIPLIWLQGPPSLHWLMPVSSPAAMTPPAPPEPVRANRCMGSTSNMLKDRVITPKFIPKTTPRIDDADVGPPSTNFPGTEFGRNTPNGVPFGIGEGTAAAMPKPPSPVHPIRISHWAEGNLIFRVQPVYPPLARQARIQGPVQLRAIISKTGTIEHLTVESGHPMLSGAAIDAVRQWRYRPYLLNDGPVAIETEITVNFVLSGS